MCQLLGMNCNTPTDICFSFEGFHMRGGQTDHHKDGWGIAFFERGGCRMFVDEKATIDSPIADLVRRYPIRSMNVIAHIRKATQGSVSLLNTHPFMRELWGQYWIFAHNGNLAEFDPPLDGTFQPVGQTDSERAFCWMLQQLRGRSPSARPPLAQLRGWLAEITAQIATHGEFNFLLSNGDGLFVHCATRLSYVVRQAPFTVAHLKDQDVTVDFSQVTTPDDRVAVIATLPLTDNEEWTTIEPGSLLLFVDGAPVPDHQAAQEISMTALSTLTIKVHASPEFVEHVLPDLQDGRWSDAPPQRGLPIMIGQTESEAAFESWTAALDSAGIGYEIPPPARNAMAGDGDDATRVEISVGRGPGAGQAF